MSKIEELVKELAQPIIQKHSLELVDVEYIKEGGNWILRIIIDKPEGINFDDCQNVSNELSKILDLKDPIDHNYSLEVSSPGLERPLKSDQDFEKYKGEKINLSTYGPINGEKKFTGELVGLINNEVEIITDEGNQIKIPKNQIASARLAVDF